MQTLPTSNFASLSQILAGRSLYHVTPLHYFPSILADRALLCQSVLAARGISSRPSVRGRDRMVGLADFVHFSLSANTPLLIDKLRKGYAHVCMEFDAQAVVSLPMTGVVKYNAKSWWTGRSSRLPIPLMPMGFQHFFRALEIRVTRVSK